MERERRFELRGWFGERGIKQVVFDMDGTLVDTWTHYRERMGRYCGFLSEAGNGTKSEIELLNVFLQGISLLRDEFQVRPAVLEVPARVLARMCGVDGPELERQVSELMMIYELSPKVFPKAVDQVRLVRDAGVETALVTHAGEEWTGKKMREFRGLFGNWVCTPTDRPKDAQAWRSALGELGLDPSGVMVVGDSWVSDIDPALTNGIKIAVWVRNGAISRNNDRVIEIEAIAGLVDGLLLA